MLIFQNRLISYRLEFPTVTHINTLQKTAIAVAHCKAGKGLLKINGQSLNCIANETLRFKVSEPILLLGAQRFANLDIRIRVTGGGYTAQVYGTLAFSHCPKLHSILLHPLALIYILFP